MEKMQSESIKEIATAIAKMQAKIEGVGKDASNPHFKTKYASLAACWDACHGPASENGIAIVQTTDMDDGGRAWLYTTLMHASGEWVRSRLPLIYSGNNPMQALGSAITYARRYGLCAAVGLAPEDDDGQGAGNGAQPKTAAPAALPKMPPKPADPPPYRAKLDKIKAAFAGAPNRVALEAIYADNKAHLGAMPDAARDEARDAYKARLADVSEAAA